MSKIKDAIEQGEFLPDDTDTEQVDINNHDCHTSEDDGCKVCSETGNMPNYKIHVATGEFCFIEKDCETLEEAEAEHSRIRSIFADKEGLNQVEWAKVRNKYVNTGDIEIEDMESLSKAQKFVINQIKLSIRSNEK